MNIRFLTPTIHGVLDYSAAVVLIIAPAVLKLDEVSPFAYWLSVVAGGVLIFYSLLTDYALGMRKRMPFKMHLGFDLSAGVVFVVWPFIFGVTGLAMTYYIVMGLGIMLVVAVTEPE
jgi:hypothetical protein